MANNNKEELDMSLMMCFTNEELYPKGMAENKLDEQTQEDQAQEDQTQEGEEHVIVVPTRKPVEKKKECTIVKPRRKTVGRKPKRGGSRKTEVLSFDYSSKLKPLSIIRNGVSIDLYDKEAIDLKITNYIKNNYKKGKPPRFLLFMPCVGSVKNCVATVVLERIDSDFVKRIAKKSGRQFKTVTKVITEMYEILFEKAEHGDLAKLSHRFAMRLIPNKQSLENVILRKLKASTHAKIVPCRSSLELAA